MKKVYLSENADNRLIEYIKFKGYEIELVHGNLSSPISSHPDLYFCALPDGVYMGDASRLEAEYPKDVLFNAAWVGEYFLCSKYTDLALRTKAESSGLKLVFLRQGYVKCNLVVIDATHVITSDEGIAKALNNTEIKCLLVEKNHVKLPGYDYGFLGGASGRLDDELVFNGDLSAHPDFERIKAFCPVKIKYFPDFPLTDIGSIIV